ncbi:hypothetical protein GCM10010331_78710 [Streptomyces xanthochromogenes]|nr:hypothetical protein GCM10010331_78710 [Streptomyces xanthochromogenes]
MRHRFGRGARQYCGALGKRANCQIAVSVHAATDTASCPLDWQLYLPPEWTEEPDRCHRTGVLDEAVAHQEKWRLALGMLDTVAGWQWRRRWWSPTRATASALRSGPAWRNAGCPMSSR